VAPDISLSSHRSGDGTRKWLLQADAAQAFEMFVHSEPTTAGTLCISPPGRLALDCSFLRHRPAGLHRNLMQPS